MGDELARCVVDQRRFAASLDTVEHLAKGSGLSAAGGAKKGEVTGLDPARDRHRPDAQGIRATILDSLRSNILFACHTGPAKHPVGERILALYRHGALDQPNGQHADSQPDKGPCARYLYRFPEGFGNEGIAGKARR